jgi:hypothetical protein
MDHRAADLFADLRRFIESFGVLVKLTDMDIETPGEFDGLSITINPKHDGESACFYLAHSFGSIVPWSTDVARAQKVFDDLREAKKRQRQEAAQFELALGRFRGFEETSSEHAVWILGQIGHAGVIDPYTVFFRADLEAMTIFHRTGKAPRWPDFFSEWKQKVATGEIRIQPFEPRPFSRFQPIRIEQQEVLQERD